MPKTKTNCQRTFTACWTCRRRNVRCDKAVPSCAQCQRMKVDCEGYHIRLVWVDSETGQYLPQQRRAYPCESTWRGYPAWSLRDVGHLIDDCEHGGRCGCGLHSVPNPFGVFSQRPERSVLPKDRLREEEPELPSPSDSTPTSRRESEVGTVESSQDSEQLIEDGQSSTCHTYYGTGHEGQGAIYASQRVRTVSEEGGFSTEGVVIEGHPEKGHTYNRGQNLDRFASMLAERRARSLSITQAPSQPSTPFGSQYENRLFHHYVTYVSLIMVPIDDGRNPWKSTYPSIAVQDMASYSARSLYHAILAQSAFNLANLKGSLLGAVERSYAMRYLGMALRELRRSLATPTEDYSSVLAALLTVTIVEDVFHGKSRGWRHHFRGAMGFIIQYLDRQPWRLSCDAWIITQNFVLSNVVAQTVGKCPPVVLSGDSPVSAPDSISEIYGVLSDVMRRSIFGFTIGGTARLIKSVYQIRLLEEQMSLLGHQGAGDVEEDDGLAAQVEEIMQQLQVPLEGEIAVYCEQQGDGGAITILPRTRTLANLHLHLFNGAVMIYLLRMVLKYPPSAVAEYVWEVLSDTVAFIELYGGSVSVWPVFVAAAEAYTPESQALAERFLEFSGKLGAGNRADIQRVIRRVWAEREQLAMAHGCDPGDILLDWREVMARLDLDILLL